jgi:Arc/MetJ-type ribon-helix-helix transcriptional regulator
VYINYIKVNGGIMETSKSKRVNMSIPLNDYDLIQNHIIEKGIFISVPEYIRHLIKEDLKKRGLTK